MVGTYGLALSLDKIFNFLEPRWGRLKGYISLDSAGSGTEDGRLKERSSGQEANLTSSRAASDGSAKVSSGRATGPRWWKSRRKRAGPDPGTQLELV